MPYINPYTSWNKPVCELGKQKFWRYQHVCVPHTEHLQNSNWNSFLILVLRNTESLKKFNLSFPLWLCCEWQPGLHSKAGTERG